MMKRVIKVLLTGCCVLAIALLTNGLLNTGLLFEKEAEAARGKGKGRPRPPRRVAGVARRTSRRVVRRTSYYVATLPHGYTTVVIDGASLYLYRGTYYQAYGSQYVVIEIH